LRVQSDHFPPVRISHVLLGEQGLEFSVQMAMRLFGITFA
jgi:hypothetical protein